MQAGSAQLAEAGNGGDPELMALSDPLPRAKDRLQVRQESRGLFTGGTPLGVKVTVVPLGDTPNNPLIHSVDGAEDSSGLSNKDERGSKQPPPIYSGISGTCVRKARPWIASRSLHPAGEAHLAGIGTRTRHLDEHRGFVVATAAHERGRLGLLFPRPGYAEAELPRTLDYLPDRKGGFDHAPAAASDAASWEGRGAEHRVLRSEPGEASAHVQPSLGRRAGVKLARCRLPVPMSS